MTFGESARPLSIPRRVLRTTLFEREWALVLLGLFHTLAYVGFLVVMHLRSLAWASGQVLDPLKWYWRWFYRSVISEERAMASRRSPEAAIHPFLLLASLAVISAIYLLLLWRLRRLAVERQPGLGVLIGLAALASLPLMFLPNLLSGDVYSYVAFGRIAVVHGGNPFIDPPSAFTDPFLKWVNWKTVASVYGPAWIYPSMLLTIIVNSIKPHVITYVVAYKLLAALLHLLNGVLIWSILSRSKPEQRAWGTALYLLSPLALIEFVGNAHNDVLMITVILFAVWLHQREHWYWTIAALTLAVLTKWIALPLLPLYGLVLMWESPTWRERFWRASAALAIFASLCVALYRPYWEGPRTLAILFKAPPQQRLINSLGDVVANEIQRGMWRLGEWPNPALADPTTLFATTSSPVYRGVNRGDSTLDAWDQQSTRFQRDRAWFRAQQNTAQVNRDRVNAWVRTGALVILGVACLVGAAVVRNMRLALLAGAWIFFVYCAIGAVWFWPWYVTWFVALAALLDWRVTGRTAVMLSLLSPLTYTFFPSLPDPLWWQRYRAVMIFGPPILFASWHGIRIIREAWRGWRARRKPPVPAAA